MHPIRLGFHLDQSQVFNKYLDEDGCPDSTYVQIKEYQFLDSDFDGIEDRWDQCNFQPENYNDYLDWDGCPDVIPPPL
ncbi:unnamed protein product, partial [marine sediment metagenome]